MLRYMLDTYISSYIMKRSDEAVLRRLQATPIAEVCISVITQAELMFGVELSPRRTQDEAALEAYLRCMQVIEFPAAAARHYAEIRAALKRQGARIGANDLWIVAHARFLDLVVVTKNTREFSRVPELKVENWAGE